MKISIGLMIILPVSAFILSCNDRAIVKEDRVIPVILNEPAACYGLFSNKDTVLLHFGITDNKASGELVYNLWQKDKNSGTFRGEMNGDTLFANYTFMSEGIESSRELAFLKVGDGFSEGYGRIDEKSGQPDFSDKSAIKFDSNFVLRKMDCGKDSHGCMALFGTVWSVVKNSCQLLSPGATRLDPIEMKDKGKSAAFVIFSDNQDMAELYLPMADSSIILPRMGKEGSHVWQKDDLKLISWKGYVLKKGNLAIYGGM
ncbi:MAG: hypothetical protein ABI687_10615 [Flavitalea sp.]